ncbi:hypothetical protein SBA2_250048 [Acidobacteriia bacterium SbA2]|nr:hypothetical protein SBA2_250048 [Acidobacteriia bacterium SbA2]
MVTWAAGKTFPRVTPTSRRRRGISPCLEKQNRARFLAEFTQSTQSEIPSLRSGQALRGVYAERQSEILRSAQNDKRRAQDDSEGLGMTRERVFPQPLQSV